MRGKTLLLIPLLVLLAACGSSSGNTAADLKAEKSAACSGAMSFGANAKTICTEEADLGDTIAIDALARLDAS